MNAEFRAIHRKLNLIMEYLGIPAEVIAPSGTFSVVWKDGFKLMEGRSYAECEDFVIDHQAGFKTPLQIVKD